MALMQCAAIVTFVHVYKIIALVSCLFVYANVQFLTLSASLHAWNMAFSILWCFHISVAFHFFHTIKMFSFHSDTIYKQTHTHTQCCSVNQRGLWNY